VLAPETVVRTPKKTRASPTDKLGWPTVLSVSSTVARQPVGQPDGGLSCCVTGGRRIRRLDRNEHSNDARPAPARAATDQPFAGGQAGRLVLAAWRLTPNVGCGTRLVRTRSNAPFMHTKR
jgi:hypothetical protein